MLRLIQVLKGHIQICEDFQTALEKIQKEVAPLRVVSFLEDTFKIEHAKEVVAQAYLSESQTKYIVMGAVEFTAVAQNSLLKLLEEPPKNVEFILLTPSKSNLLPTVRSRLPIMQTQKAHDIIDLDLSLAQLDYAKVFTFLKEHARVSKNEAKIIVESLFIHATQKEKIQLTQQQLENFDTAYRLLDLNGRVQNVLAMILMSFAKG